MVGLDDSFIISCFLVDIGHLIWPKLRVDCYLGGGERVPLVYLIHSEFQAAPTGSADSTPYEDSSLLIFEKT